MSASSHCAVMRNPFSTAVAAAKIPDGMATLSTASRLSVSSKVEATDGEASFLIYPGFYSGLSIRYGTADTSVSPPVQGPRRSLLPNWGYLPSRQLNLTAVGAVGQTIFVTGQPQVPNNYRVVSQGIRFSLINNSLDNDGYFEAIRVAPSYSTREIVLAGLSADGRTETAVADGGRCYLGYDPQGFESGMLETDAGSFNDWSMNPSYVTGKLRDIHKHTFILHRIEDNEFQNVQDQNALVRGNASTGGFANGVVELLRTAGDECYFIDRKLDAILVRCRASASIVAPLVIHYHLVQHVEEMYDQNSDLARFQTISPAAPKLVTAVVNAIKRDIKPGIVRAPTMPVSINYGTRKKKVYRKRRYGR